MTTIPSTCPNCDLAPLEIKGGIDFGLTWPEEVYHCPVCGASYIDYNLEFIRYFAAEGCSYA